MEPKPAVHVEPTAYLGRSEQRTDTVGPQLVRAMAATLDVPTPTDGCLPVPWHWMLFQEWAAAHALGADGHPRRGGFLPAEPALPRRMWAGGRLQFHRPLQIDEPVTRTTTITRVEEKSGASGRLLFVTLKHVIAGDAGVAISEEQDLVYRGDQSAASTEAAANPVAGASRRIVAIDTPLLFRYSALTGNAHRIHYDRDYAQQVEGYASLVVHGPLQATLLAGYATTLAAGRTLKSFSFRGRRPALLHRCPLTLEAWEERATLQLRSLDSDGVVCTTAEAGLAP
jgi:hydroxyacyl-ACP dehydratase HTD2-like protein with hotdog domain